MRLVLTIALLLSTIYSCKSKKNITPSSIGVAKLTNYVINPAIELPEELNYFIFTNADKFHTHFSMTKSSPGTIVVPQFNVQSVVAIALKPTTKVISVEINKATIAGNDLNIHFTVVDTTTWTTFIHTPTIAATVPKSTVKQVNFYNSSIKEKTLPITY